MTRKANSLPTYLLHKPTGQTPVRISGKDHYLGPFGSEEFRVTYGKLIDGGAPLDPIATSKRGSQLPQNDSEADTQKRST